MFTDSHTHLYLDSFSDDRDQVIERAIGKGITKMLLPNIDVNTIDPLHELSDRYPENCFPMMGLHPTSIKGDYRAQLKVIESRLSVRNYAAIGESGIDLYWDKSFLKEQLDSFKIQIKWAKQLGIPIVIHSRNSFDEIFKTLDETWEEGLSGVFHSFSGNQKQLARALSFGFYIGINGIITFKNNDIADVVADIPLNRILLETDAPFLTPVPFRGKRNESSYLVYIAQKISEIYKLSVDQLAALTSENAADLFKRINE